CEEHRLAGHEQDHPHHGAAGAPDGALVDLQVGACVHEGVSSPASPCAASRMSRTGRREWTSGSRSKLWGGGGEVVAHSSEFPVPQASLGASRGFRRDMNTLTKKMIIETAMM